MGKDLSYAIGQLAGYTILVPLIIALIGFRKLNWLQKVLFYFVLVSIIVEVAAILVGRKLGMNNLFLLHMFTIIEFTFLLLIYKKEIPPLIKAEYFKYIIAGFILFAVVDSIYIEGLNQFNTYGRGVESFVILILAIVYFYKILSEVKIKKLEAEPMFWFNTGLLIYFSGSLFIFIFSNYIEPSDTLSLTFWGIHAILTILKNFFFAITLWIKPPKPALLI